MLKHTQLDHDAHTPSGHKSPLSLLADNLKSPLNVGSLFRLSDALGIAQLYLCGNTATPPNKKINKTSRSTEKYVDYHYYEDAEQLVRSLKEDGSVIISLEITCSSAAIDSQTFAREIRQGNPVCLILGAEDTGVNPNLLALSDLSVHIPMAGQNSSMNVVSAASIACYETIRLQKNSRHLGE